MPEQVSAYVVISDIHAGCQLGLTRATSRAANYCSTREGNTLRTRFSAGCGRGGMSSGLSTSRK